MMTGIHSDLRVSSQHKRAVSSVLHLKRESGGRSKPTAYNKVHAFKSASDRAFAKAKKG